MKTKEELNVLKEEVEALNKKLVELNEEELAQVSGGSRLKRIMSPDNTNCHSGRYYRERYPGSNKPQTCGNCAFYSLVDGYCSCGRG